MIHFWDEVFTVLYVVCVFVMGRHIFMSLREKDIPFLYHVHVQYGKLKASHNINICHNAHLSLIENSPLPLLFSIWVPSDHIGVNDDGSDRGTVLGFGRGLESRVLEGALDPKYGAHVGVGDQHLEHGDHVCHHCEDDVVPIDWNSKVKVFNINENSTINTVFQVDQWSISKGSTKSS